MDDVSSILQQIIDSETPDVISDASTWWAQHRSLISKHPTPQASAMLGGARADRIAWAFASGYHAALQSLIPGQDPLRTCALCATEAQGVHPRHIETTLGPAGLSGEKSFVTLGTLAERLLIVARVGEKDGRPELGLFEVEASAKGITFMEAPPVPFAPEIAHARIALDSVQAFTHWPGDGWTEYLKPFRTIEDIYVHLAALSWLMACGIRFGWPQERIEAAAGLTTALYTLTFASFTAPATHLALAGCIRQTTTLIAALDEAWNKAPEADRQRYERDRPLLEIASQARAQRRARAWSMLTGERPSKP